CPRSLSPVRRGSDAGELLIGERHIHTPPHRHSAPGVQLCGLGLLQQPRKVERPRPASGRSRRRRPSGHAQQRGQSSGNRAHAFSPPPPSSDGSSISNTSFSFTRLPVSRFSTGPSSVRLTDSTYPCTSRASSYPPTYLPIRLDAPASCPCSTSDSS